MTGIRSADRCSLERDFGSARLADVVAEHGRVDEPSRAMKQDSAPCRYTVRARCPVGRASTCARQWSTCTDASKAKRRATSGSRRLDVRLDGNTIHVRYEWTVDVVKDWMVLLSPIVRPLFAWNHHFVMRGVYRD